MKGGQLLRVEAGLALVQFAGLAPALADFRAGAFQHGFVVGVFPLNEIADDCEQLFALGVGLFFGLAREIAALAAGVVDHLREQHRARRGQRPARPPQMQRARMPVPNGFLACGGGVDIVQW